MLNQKVIFIWHGISRSQWGACRITKRCWAVKACTTHDLCIGSFPEEQQGQMRSIKGSRQITLLGLQQSFQQQLTVSAFIPVLEKTFFLSEIFPTGSWAIIHCYLVKCDPQYTLARKAIFVFHNFDTVQVMASLLFDNQNNGQETFFVNVIKIRFGIRGKPVILWKIN